MIWTVGLEGGPRRVNHAAVAIDGSIWSFGGYCSGESLNPEQPIDVHVLNTETYRWHAVHAANEKYAGKGAVANVSDMDTSSDDEDDLPAPPPQEAPQAVRDQYAAKYSRRSVPYQRYGHTVCAYNGKAYLWGGRNDEFGASASLHEFDPVTRHWSLIHVAGRVPPARDGHSAVVVGSEMYLFGGFEEELQRFSQETYVFDFKTNRWTEMITYGSAPLWRDFHTAVAIGHKMYVFGGRSDQMGQYHSTRDIYDERLKVLDLTSGEWSDPVVHGQKPGGRRSHSAWVYNDRMFLFGGYQGTLNKHYNELYSFDPVTNNWDRLETIGTRPEPRRRQCTVVVDDRLFLFGGTMPSPSGTDGMTATGLSDLADLYVLDYSPSLRMLAARRLIDLKLHKRLLYTMPRDVSRDVLNMVTPNAIMNPPAARIDVAG